MNSPFLVCAVIMCNKSYIMLRICTIEKGSGIQFYIFRHKKSTYRALNIMNRQIHFPVKTINFASVKKASAFKCLLRPKLSLLSMNFTSITQIFMIVD